MKRPLITCTCCQGSGHVELPRDLWRTLQLIGELGQVTAAQVHARLCSNNRSVSSANNRLETLRRLGLVQRTEAQTGKAWICELRRPQ